ncbi:uncharacterized protein LOC143832391 [Paroedura picta]|uniref:uncharacterized protein LOC143832391 n=1 Tax=Paroedura picta TaxID=143630 RepID=UPI00405611DA
MGCAHSTESLSTQTDEDSEAAPDPAEPSKRKGKKILSPNIHNTPEQKSVELKPPNERSENTTIRVIWRRVSIFGGRRDSSKSCKTLEEELPGPGENSLVPPGMSSNT